MAVEREGWRSQRTLQIAGFSLAIAATVAWVLAATGRLSSGAIIGWWFGWSVYEVLIRLSGRRYVKDGPWWQDNYRHASVMDMLSYVSFKNLLIGAALFLTLKTLGLDVGMSAAMRTALALAARLVCWRVRTRRRCGSRRGHVVAAGHPHAPSPAMCWRLNARSIPATS